MHKARMRELSRMLGRLAQGETFVSPFTPLLKHRFDMRYWFRAGDRGTAACALGHAALCRTFSAQGLQLTTGSPQWQVVFGDAHGGLAAAKFFGISVHNARRLFLPESYCSGGPEYISPGDITPRMVKLRVDRLLAGEKEL